MTPEAIQMVNEAWGNFMLFIVAIAAAPGVGALVYMLISWRSKP